MATRPKAVIESRNGEKFSPITIAKNVLTDDGQNLHDILSDRKEDMMTPTIENSSSMFKVGQGDNVDYSENVVDGAYESCVLKGVTKFIDNNTGETLDSFVENRDLSLIDCKSPILSNVGKNLIPSSEEIVFPSGTNMGIQQPLFSVKLKPNTTYVLSGYFTQNVGANGYCLFLNSENIIFSSHNDAYANTPPENRLQMNVKFTTNAINVYATITANSGVLTGEAIYSHCQLEESPTKTTYEPYKTNILSCNEDKIELTEDMFEQGTINETHAPKDYNAIKTQSSGAYFNKRVRLKSPLPIKPNTTYIINVSNNYDVFVGFCLDGVFLDNYIGYKGNVVFTTPSNCNEIALVIKNGNDEDILIANFSIDNIRLSEVDKTIVLRSLPNGVCDTLNVETEEYVQRIGEVVLDGSENWAFYGATGEGVTTAFKLSLTGHISAWIVGNGHCDRLKFVSGDYIYNTNNEGITTDANNFVIRVLNEKASTIEEFKSYLKTKPLTVQYELATPIIKTVDLSGYPFSYENGHVILSSGSIEQSLTPKVEYSVATNRNGQIRSNQKMVERHQKQLDQLQAMILTNLVNTQYEQTLTNLKYDLKNVREEVK